MEKQPPLDQLRGRVLILVLLALLPFTALAGEVARVSADELEAELGKPGVVIIDVRTGNDWRNSVKKIKGALREDPYNAKVWSSRYDKDDRYVLYCS